MATHGLHRGEAARAEQETHWDFGLSQPRVAPGSFEEQELLEKIDRGRDEELAALGDTFARRRKRQRAHWRRHL